MSLRLASRSSASSIAFALFAVGGVIAAAACSKKSNDEPVINDPALQQSPTTPKPVATAAAGASSGTTASAAPAKGFGIIEGTVKLTGTPPEMKPVDKVSDPVCQVHPPKDNSVLVGQGGGLKDVLVRIENGGAEGEVPATPVKLEQHDCMYVPRILGVMTGQAIEYVNADKTMHNVHTYLGSETKFNAGQPAGDTKKSTIDDDGVIKVKCDVHPWMTAYIVATDHPYFAVTDENGHFKIEKVPAGKYRLEAYHSQYGWKEVKDFEVGPGKGGDPGFSYTGTEQPAQ